jgi:peptidoglycan/xylan/chitin deacetylase (PgdA/CDA1 family)
LTRAIPILLYHSIAADPPPGIAPWTVRPDDFLRQLDHLAEAGFTAITVSRYRDALRHGPTRLPARLVVITFDDGYADTAELAVPALAERGLPATLYVTTGMLRGGPAGGTVEPPGRMLDWSELADLEARSIEIGAHSHTHPQLDTLPSARARDEIVRSRDLLEDRLGHPVRSFAYPHGYSSRAVRHMVAQAGFDSACAVRNALSSTRDDLFTLARLTVLRTTSMPELRRWVDGTGAGVAPSRERLATTGWRMVRRVRARTVRR